MPTPPFARKQDAIDAEARIGIYLVRTKLAAASLDDSATV
jgi:hypothetical protein